MWLGLVVGLDHHMRGREIRVAQMQQQQCQSTLRQQQPRKVLRKQDIADLSTRDAADWLRSLTRPKSQALQMVC